VGQETLAGWRRLSAAIVILISGAVASQRSLVGSNSNRGWFSICFHSSALCHTHPWLGPNRFGICHDLIECCFCMLHSRCRVVLSSTSAWWCRWHDCVEFRTKIARGTSVAWFFLDTNNNRRGALRLWRRPRWSGHGSTKLGVRDLIEHCNIKLLLRPVFCKLWHMRLGVAIIYCPARFSLWSRDSPTDLFLLFVLVVIIFILVFDIFVVVVAVLHNNLIANTTRRSGRPGQTDDLRRGRRRAKLAATVNAPPTVHRTRLRHHFHHILLDLNLRFYLLHVAFQQLALLPFLFCLHRHRIRLVTVQVQFTVSFLKLLP